MIDAAHEAGMTDDEIHHEVDMAHDAGISNGQLSEGFHMEQEAGHSPEQMMDDLHHAEEHASHNAHNGDHTHHDDTENAMVDAAHAIGMTDEEINHEVEMSHEAGISNSQVIDGFQHGEEEGLSGEEMFDELHHAEENHNGHANGDVTDGDISLTNEDIEETGGYHAGSQTVATDTSDLEEEESGSVGAIVAYSLLGVASALLFAVFGRFFYKQRKKEMVPDLRNTNMAPYSDNVPDLV